MAKEYRPYVPETLLQQLGDEEFGAYNINFGNFSLKVGVAVRVYNNDDKGNIRKLGPEYDVVTIEQSGDKGSTAFTYKNCMSIDSFGGIADFFEAKRRIPTKEKYASTLDGFNQDGNFVLLLCIDGNSENSVILGGVRHPARREVLTKDSDHHMEGEFNGLSFKVNKDGELTVTFKSATDNKGKPVDEEAGGTHLKMDKTGSVDINTNLEGDDETYIRMDKPNKDVGLKAGQHIGLTAKSNIGLNADSNVNIDAGASLVAKAEGTATLEAGGAFDLKAGGALKVNAPSGQLQFDSSLEVKASSVQVGAQQIQLGQGGTPAVTLNTQCLGTGNKGAPVVSTMIGPFSSVVFIAP